jgi:ABC-2 type transport system ATP-binding protein
MQDPIVDIQNLTKRYGDLTAVDNLSFRVQPGEVFALLGPNGAGKTTTIRILTGILQPTEGHASITGKDCSRQRAEIMNDLGYLPDEPTFYDYLRGREVLQFVGNMHGLDGETIATRSQPLIERLDLDEALEDYAVNYSHGMKKKLAAVCSLLHEPALLILDEPTNGLDPYATRELHGIILDHAAAGGSVMLSTHLLDQAQRLATRVGILHQGRLAACGPLEELQQSAAGETLEELFFAITGQASAAETPQNASGDAET